MFFADDFGAEAFDVEASGSPPDKFPAPRSHAPARSSIQMRERGRRRRIGQIVRRNVNGLDRRIDPFLVDVMRSCNLPFRPLALAGNPLRSACVREATFRACLRETKDVIDEQKHILIFFIAEIFRHGERREGHAQTRARRLVHLAVNQRHLGFAEILLIDHVRFAHFGIQIVAFARPFAHTTEDGKSSVPFGDVVDQLHDDDRLANSGAPNAPTLPPSNGQIKSITLIPVSRTCALTSRS